MPPLTPGGQQPGYAPHPGKGGPPGQSNSTLSTAFVEVMNFVFNPHLVMAFLHRPAAEGSVPVTEVLYQNHHVSIEDPNQALYYFLRKRANPEVAKTTL